MASQTINFITWNINGLKQHRDQKFQEIQKADVVFLQETHIGVGDENIIEGLKNEWCVFYTKYTSFSKGAAILVKKTLDFECISDEKDNCGAYVVLKCKLEGQLYTLVSVYNHETDKKTLDKLSRYLQSMTTGLLVIGGDFNTVLNRFIDKKWNTIKMTNNRSHSKLLSFVEILTKSLQLVDVWRRKNPKTQDYTFYIKDCPVSRLDYFFVPEECMWRISSCEIRHSEITDHRPVSLEINNIPAMPFQKDPQIQSIFQLLNLKKDLLTDETGSSLGEESSHAVSEVDIVSAVHSLQVSDTQRPDGIPVSFYKDNIQVIIPYIKTLYDRIHSGAFNCSETYFNESLKCSHNDRQHFFNVDYLIIATILARRMDDFLKPESKGMLKDSATVMITSKTLGTQTILCCLNEIKEQMLSKSTLCQDFLTVENLLREAEDFSPQKDNLLCQGCPLTPVLLTSALKCYTLKLCENLNNYAIHVCKLNLIVCISPEDLDKVHAMVNSPNEEYDIETLSSGKRHKPLHLSSVHDKTSDEDCDGSMEAAEKNCPGSDTESEMCEESDYWSNGHEEKDKSMEIDGRMTMYTVVTLQDSDEVMVVASNWLSEDKKQCYWPPFKSPIKCLEAVKNRLEPATGEKPWEKLAVLFHAEYGTYEQAKEKQEAMSEQTEEPVKPKNQVIETSPLSSVPSQSAGISSDGSMAQNIHPIIVSQGIKRKQDLCDSPTSAKLHPDKIILRMAKQIMTEVKIRIQNINSADNTTTTLITNILDDITMMEEMDKDKRRNETIGVFGKTGEGKSSLLNAILGLDYVLPSGCSGACTAIVTQVEANLTDSNYIVEIEFISKEQWEDEIASTDKRIEAVKERITAVYGDGADKKTLEELKKEDNYAEIEKVLSTKTKTISRSEVSKFSEDVARHIQHSKSSPGDWYWPLVKSVKLKIPNCQELLEHIVLVDIPGTGDCNKIRDDIWKSTLRECSSVWIVTGIKRAITDKDPWGILNHCIQDLGPGGECKNINFICTSTDEIDPKEYLRSVRLSEDQISLDKDLKTGCILHRNNCAKEIVKKMFENLEIMKLKAGFNTDVFTVSSKAYLDKTTNPNLEPIKTEIPKLQDVLKKTNRSINRQLTRDYINEAKGLLSLIQSIQLDTDEKMAEIKTVVHKDLEESLVMALNELDHQLDLTYKILDQCLSKGVEESVELCVKTTKSMMASVAPDDKRGFHKTLQALYKNKGYFWPKNWDAPLDLNMILAKHMHDNIDKEFNSIFPVDANKTGISVQEQIDKFSIIQSGNAYSPSSMLYHMENFIKTEETRVKGSLKKYVVNRKKEIYSSIQTTIQNQMTTGYEKAAELKGTGAMEKRENIIMATIELLKYNMFKDAKRKVLNEFKDLKGNIYKTLESELKVSVERSFPQTSKTTLMDVSREIDKLERLSTQLSD